MIGVDVAIVKAIPIRLVPEDLNHVSRIPEGSDGHIVGAENQSGTQGSP
jgi:hypothetical protein